MGDEGTTSPRPQPTSYGSISKAHQATGTSTSRRLLIFSVLFTIATYVDFPSHWLSEKRGSKATGPYTNIHFCDVPLFFLVLESMSKKNGKSGSRALALS